MTLCCTISMLSWNPSTHPSNSERCVHHHHYHQHPNRLVESPTPTSSLGKKKCIIAHTVFTWFGRFPLTLPETTTWTQSKQLPTTSMSAFSSTTPVTSLTVYVDSDDDGVMMVMVTNLVIAVCGSGFGTSIGQLQHERHCTTQDHPPLRQQNDRKEAPRCHHLHFITSRYTPSKSSSTPSSLTCLFRSDAMPIFGGVRWYQGLPHRVCFVTRCWDQRYVIIDLS